MNNVFNFIKGLITDKGDNSPSSKRVITVGSFIVLVAAFIANIKFGIKIDPKILETFEFITIAGLGVTGLERFATPQPKKTNITITEQ